MDDFKSLERIVEKLDESIDKLTEVSNTVGKLLAVHDTRLNILEKDTVRNEDDIRDIHFKIEGLVRELSAKIDQSMVNSEKGHARILEKVEEKIKTMDGRVKVLEIWRWLIIGGAATIAYLINKLYK